MSSVLQIWNMATGHLGQTDAITSEDESSASADACRTYYDSARRVALGGNDWGFARKYATLALVSGAIETGDWTLAYALPGDCIHVRRIVDNAQGLSDPIPFEVSIHKDASGSSVKVLLTNQEGVVVRYTADVTDPNLFDPEFETALSYFLASACCLRITRKKDLKMQLDQSAAAALDSAATRNLNEPKYTPERDAPSILARVSSVYPPMDPGFPWNVGGSGRPY